MSDLARWALVGFGSVSMFVTLVAQVAAHLKLSRRRRNRFAGPPITILRPLKGVDHGLEENLLALIRQDYATFQLVVGAEDPADPALEVAHRVKAAHPEVDFAIVHGAFAGGANPKVRNLREMVRIAKHDWVLISDSNVRPDANYLADLAAEIEDPQVCLVHNPIGGVGAETIGSALDNLHISSSITGAVALAGLARHSIVIGKSMLFRLSELERIGGFESVQDVLAEDYLLGRRFQAMGKRVAWSPHVIRAVSGRGSVRDFVARYIRWSQMRRRIAPVAYFSEPLLNPTPALIALVILSEAPMAAAGLAGLFVKCAIDLSLARRLQGRASGWQAALVVPKDLLVSFIWAVAAIRRTVVWRGHRYRIGPMSVLTPDER